MILPFRGDELGRWDRHIVISSQTEVLLRVNHLIFVKDSITALLKKPRIVAGCRVGYAQALLVSGVFLFDFKVELNELGWRVDELVVDKGCQRLLDLSLHQRAFKRLVL